MSSDSRSPGLSPAPELCDNTQYTISPLNCYGGLHLDVHSKPASLGGDLHLTGTPPCVCHFLTVGLVCAFNFLSCGLFVSQ